MSAVLIVDDEPGVLRVLVRGLATDSVRVHGAPSAEGALLVLRKQRPDVLVADIRLPGIDGFELIVLVRRIRPEIRTIVITGYPSDQVRQRAAELRVDHFVVKPLTVEEVREVVAGLLPPSTAHDGAEAPAAPEEGGTVLPEVERALQNRMPAYLAVAVRLQRAFPGLEFAEVVQCVDDVLLPLALQASSPTDLPGLKQLYRYAWRNARDRAASKRQRYQRELGWGGGQQQFVSAVIDLDPSQWQAIAAEITPLLPDEEVRMAFRLWVEERLTTDTLNAALVPIRSGRPVDAAEFDRITARLRMSLRRNREIEEVARPLRDE